MWSWLVAIARVPTFCGGCPQLIVPGNPRVLVSEACRYEPKLNDAVRDSNGSNRPGSDIRDWQPWGARRTGRIPGAGGPKFLHLARRALLRDLTTRCSYISTRHQSVEIICNIANSAVPGGEFQPSASGLGRSAEACGSSGRE